MAGATLFSFTTVPPIEGMTFALSERADAVEDLHSLLEAFGPVFRRHMQEQFATEGALAGGWADLNPRYEAWKSEHYPGRPIGVLTGALRSAMTGGAGYTEDIGSDTASYGLGGGPATVYGKYFAGGGRGPARPVLKWGSAQVRDYQKAAHLWLVDALQARAAPGESWRPL